MYGGRRLGYGAAGRAELFRMNGPERVVDDAEVALGRKFPAGREPRLRTMTWPRSSQGMPCAS